MEFAELLQPAILVVLCFFAGFVDAVAGGGGLISLPAVMSLGVPPVAALGTNKAIGICTSTASSLRYWRAGKISRATIPAAILAGICSAVGAFSASLLSPEILRPIILVLLVAAGIYVISQRGFGLKQKEVPKSRWPWIIPAVGVIGFYDGFFGPGTGVFLMMSIVIILGWPLLNASGNARLINWATNLGALTFFIWHGAVYFRLALPGSIAAFAGGLVGASWAVKHGSKGIRPVFIAVTWLLIAKVCWDFFSG